MNSTQLKASMQLAEMRLKSDPTETNAALYKQAKDAYEKAKTESAVKSESPKIEALSLDNLTKEQKEYLESLAKPKKVAEDKAAVKPAVKKVAETTPEPVKPAATVVPPVVSQTEETEDEKGSENEEKKTEE